MWVLILAIASFLVFVSTVLLLWLADSLESRTQPSRLELSAEEPFAFLSISQGFEMQYSALWEAPIRALELTRQTGRRGIPVSRLRPIFSRAAACFPEVYDGYRFEQWLQFLESIGLIHWYGQNAMLSSKGEEFLTYRFTTEALVQQ
jgi:hypothetical protein